MPPGRRSASPRVAAHSEQYQFVGIVEGEVLVIYLDRAEDNAPVTTATIDVSLDGEAFKAELQEKTRHLRGDRAAAAQGRASYEVLVTLADGGTQDLLVGTLTIPATSGQARDRPRAFARSLPMRWRLAAGPDFACLRRHPAARCAPPAAPCCRAAASC